MRHFSYLGIGLAWLACSAWSVAFGAGLGGIGSGASTPPAGSGVGTTGSTGAPGSGIGSASGVGAGSATIGSGSNLGGGGVNAGSTVGSGSIGNSSLGNSSLGNSSLSPGGTNATGTFQGQGSAVGSFGNSFPGEAGTTLQAPAGAAGNVTNPGAGPAGQTEPQGVAGAFPQQNNNNPGVIGHGKLGGELPGRTAPSNDNWRWRFYSGLWWYWMPSANQWMYYQNGSWQFFNGPVEGISTAQSQVQTPYTTGYRGTNLSGSVGGIPGVNTTNGIGAGATAPGTGGQNGYQGTPAAGTNGNLNSQTMTPPGNLNSNDRRPTNSNSPDIDTSAPTMPPRAGAGTAAAGGVRLR